MNSLTPLSLLILFLFLLMAELTVAQRATQQVLLDSAWSLYERGQHYHSKKVNRLCIDESRAANDFRTEAQCMINNGTIAYVEGNFHHAYAWYDSSLQLYVRIEDTVQTVNALRNMALTSRHLSRYEQGIRHCNTALALLRHPGREHLKGQVFNTLATLFESTNNLQQARKALQQALALTKTSSRSNIYTNLGNTYFKLNKFDSAIYCYGAALQLTTNSVFRGLVLNNMGESYIACDSLAKAEDALLASLAIREAKDPLTLISTYNNLAQLARRQQKFDDMNRYLLLVKAALAKNSNEREALKYFLLQKNYYEKTGNYRRALQFDARHDSLNRKIFEEERIKASELQTAYELSERDQQMAIQDQMLAIRSAELERETSLNRLITVIVVILILVAILFFYLYRVNARLRYKNEMLIHEQSHRVKNNLQMIASLLSIQSSAHSDQTVRSVLAQNETRIQSVALLHRMLYNAEVSPGISLRKYVEDLTTELSFALGVEDVAFQVRTEIERLSIENTVSVGLILNELITNSVKYASCNDKLKVSISLTRADNKGELRYTDNGNNFNPASFTESGRFGVRLIALQTTQLHGHYTIANADGFYFVLTFPVS